MSEGGEARNHEAEAILNRIIEAAANAGADGTLPAETVRVECLRATYALRSSGSAAQNHEEYENPLRPDPLGFDEPLAPRGASPQGDPTVPWQQWNDEVNARIALQIELHDARAEIERFRRSPQGEDHEENAERPT